MIMFIPQASPVVYAYMTWHIGPTTCVSTSRSFACFERLATGSEASQACISAELPLDPAGEAERLDGVVEEERGRARDPVADDVGAEAAGLADGARAAVERDREPALGVRERDVDALLRPAALDERPSGSSSA